MKISVNRKMSCWPKKHGFTPSNPATTILYQVLRWVRPLDGPLFYFYNPIDISLIRLASIRLYEGIQSTFVIRSINCAYTTGTSLFTIKNDFLFKQNTPGALAIW